MHLKVGKPRKIMRKTISAKFKEANIVLRRNKIYFFESQLLGRKIPVITYRAGIFRDKKEKEIRKTNVKKLYILPAI